MDNPPSTLITEPVIKLESSEARNATTFATSSGFPNLPSDVNLLTVTYVSSGITSAIFVSIKPGAIALTLTPSLPTSFDNDLVKPIIPALLAE